MSRLVYCTALINGRANPSGAADQDVYLKALRLPVHEAWRRVPVGMVNPGSGYTAGDLSSAPGSGVGRHWWRTLATVDYRSHQLPDPAGSYTKPLGW